MILTREEALKYHRQMWSDMKDVLVTIRTLMSVLDLKISGALNIFQMSISIVLVFFANM